MRSAHGGRSFSAAAGEVVGSADCQRLKRWRTTARWSGWLVAHLLHFENGAEWSDVAARRGATEDRGELRLPRLGPHRYGWCDSASLSGTRRRWNRLASCGCAAKSHRQILARPKSDSVVSPSRTGICSATTNEVR